MTNFQPRAHTLEVLQTNSEHTNQQFDVSNANLQRVLDQFIINNEKLSQLNQQLATALENQTIIINKFTEQLLKTDSLIQNQQSSIEHQYNIQKSLEAVQQTVTQTNGDVSRIATTVRLGGKNALAVTNTAADPIWTIPAG
ncbi:hypothetical protein [Changjiang hepe-like virus 1]|uniref:hypothetical protein n=1 Tax=Changjiang hepe-like virus 1 TaxID=1922772 RepID=UPI00090C464E|nr:hypothetical protein [Changjiang hepe-like virus 1]APG77608.1 hypothetical protein [Changjiang hepe-like virus 1]